MSTSFNSPNYPNNFKNNMGEIRDLEGVARQLNQKSDGLQAALKKINDRLNQLNLGLEVWVGDTRTHGYLCYGPHVSSHDLGRPDIGNVTFLHAWDLGYAKVGDNWGLAVR